MNVGDLVRIIKNDMSLVIRQPGPKDNKFFNQIGTIVERIGNNDMDPYDVHCSAWWGIQLPTGYYLVRSDAIEVIDEMA